jgi:four helix bundle protein
VFDFEKLDVYNKAKDLNKEILEYLKTNKQTDSYLRDQLKRASISIVINIAEGTGKFSKADKKNFYTINVDLYMSVCRYLGYLLMKTL